MKLLLQSILLLTIFLSGCEQERDSSTSRTEPDKPAKVEKLLSMIEKLTPGTDVADWLAEVNHEISLPHNRVVLHDQLVDGGAAPDGHWLVIGIGAGDDWVLSIKSTIKNAETPEERQLWEARIMRMSISKALANEGWERETVFPLYSKGTVIWEEPEYGGLEKNRVEQDDAPNPLKTPTRRRLPAE